MAKFKLMVETYATCYTKSFGLELSMDAIDVFLTHDAKYSI